jgi:hypothetical protein
MPHTQLALLARWDPGGRGYVVFARVLKPAGHFVSGVTLVATAATTLALLPAASAFAADGTVTPTPTSAPNTGTRSISFKTSDTWLAQPAPTVTVARHGVPSDSLKVSNVTVTGGTVSGDVVKADVDFIMANTGPYDVTINGTTAGPPPTPNTTDSCQGCLLVTSPLTVTSASPNRIQASGTSDSSATVVVSGTGFAKGSTLSIVDVANNPAPGVSVSDTSPATANTGTKITKVVKVAQGSPGGTYDVRVTQTDGTFQVCAGCFAVDPAMQVDSVSPLSMQVGSSGQTVTINGSGFASDAVATFKHTDDGSAASEITIGSQSVSTDHTTITLNNVSISSGASPRHFDIYISSKSESVNDVFKDRFQTVAPPKPASVSYDSNPNGQGDYGQGAGTSASLYSKPVFLTVHGSGFVADTPASSGAPASPGTRVTISPDGGLNYDINNETATTTTVQIPLTIDATAPTGSRTLTVTNPDGSSTTCNNATNVTANTCVLSIAAAPAITKISPPSLSVGQTGNITITGTGFDASTDKNRLVIAGSTVNSVTPASSTSITANVTASSTSGPENVTLSNPTDNGVTTCPNCFNVDSLVVSSFTPTTHDNNGDVTLDIKGSDFDPATVSVTLEMPATNGRPEIDVPGKTQSSPAPTATEFTAVVPLKGAEPGAYEVVVTNGGTKPGTGTASDPFTVTDANSGPTISAVKPSTLPSGSSDQTVEIDGSDFYPHTAVSFSFPANGGGSVTVKSVNYVNSGKLTVVVDVAGGVTSTQNGTVTVTNTDGKHASSAFTITPAPSMSSTVSPASQSLNTTQFTMTFGANNAQNGATVDFPGASFLNAGPTTISAADSSTPKGFNQKVTTTVTIGPNPTAGTYDVRLTNPDHGTASCVQCFTLTAVPPGAPTGVTGTSGNQQVTVSWSAPNNNGTRIDSYTITTSPGGSKTTVSAPDANSQPPTSGTVTGLTNGTAYTFTVTAHNAGGNGPASASSAPVTPVAKPNAPTNVTATAGDTKATVSWTAPTPASGDSIKDYVVKTNPNGPTVTVAAGTTSTDVTGLTNGTSYSFTVVVEFTSGATADSAPSNAVTPFGKPSAPTNVTASSSDGKSVTVSWTASNDNGATIDSFTVTASPGGKTVTVTGSASSAPATTATVDGLSNGGTYTFTVVAHNKAGSSPASAASNSVTLSTPAPTTLTLSSTAGHLVSGHAFTLGGSLTSGSGSAVAGATISVSARLDSGQTITVGSTTTGSDGRWIMSVRPTHNATYTASFAGNSQYAPATSSSGRVTVAPKVTIAAAGVSHHATALAVTGSVSPNKAGRTVRLIAVRSNGVRKTFTATLTGRSAYKFKVKLGKGKWRLVVRIGRTSGNTAGQSAAKSVKRT